MDYLVDGKQYSLSYSELKDHYITFKDMSDEEFLDNIPDILHFACIVCFLKEVPTYICLSDKGIIHELTHLLCEGTREETLNEIQEVRETFNLWCALA